MSLMQRAALGLLEAEGWRCFRQAADPGDGTLWTSRRGRVRMRDVLVCSYGRVVYRPFEGGDVVNVSLRTWHRWRRRVRAREIIPEIVP